DADVLLACGIDERASDEDGEEGAAALALCAGEGEGPRVAGIASAGPQALERAIEAALSSAGLASVDARFVREAAVCAPSFSSARLAVDAVQALRDGARSALIAAAGSHISCAVVLSAGE